MEDVPETPRVRPSDAAMALLLAAGHRKSLAELWEGVGKVAKTSLETGGVLRQFLLDHPDAAQGFVDRAGIDRAALDVALERERPPEAQPNPPRLEENPTEEKRKLHEMFKQMDDERRAKGEAAPFSGPLRDALRHAKTTAQGGAERYGAAHIVAALLETPSNARDAVLEVAGLQRLEEAFAWLRIQPDPPGKGLPDLREIKARGREAVDAAWPGIQAKVRGGEEARDRFYEQDPSRYEAPVDVAAELLKPVSESLQGETWQNGVLLRAAENEARIRRAPEATLDHLFVALLRDGTDTAAFLDARGVDRTEWSRRLDAALPRFADGSRWPPNARDLGMSVPDYHTYRFHPIPEGKDYKTLTPEERKVYVELVVDPGRRYTDLRFLQNVLDEPKTVAWALFEEAGITGDRLQAEIVGREKGDPD